MLVRSTAAREPICDLYVTVDIGVTDRWNDALVLVQVQIDLNLVVGGHRSHQI